MIFHENRLLADDSHEISYLIFDKTRKDVAKSVACCSRDWRFNLHVFFFCHLHFFFKNNVFEKKMYFMRNHQNVIQFRSRQDPMFCRANPGLNCLQRFTGR